MAIRYCLRQQADSAGNPSRRDLDLIKETNARAPSVVFFSLISSPDSPTYERVRQMENLAPRMERRYAAMEQIAKAGILTGISMMPILPGLCDTDENLEATIRATAEHGGRFVVAGELTLADQQRDYFLSMLRERFPDLLPLYQQVYPDGSYGAVRSSDPHTVGRRIRELCGQYGILDRMPRPVIPGDKRALNKRVVEALANQCYWMELDNAPGQRVWAYRKAAWAIEDTETWRQKNRELETMREELLHQAGQEAEAWRQELIRKARQEMADTRARWQQAIEQEQEAFLHEIRQRTLRQVQAIARRALADLANADLEGHLVEVFIRRLSAESHQEVGQALRLAQPPFVIRTAFSSPPEMRHKLQAVVRDHLEDGVEVRFETAPDLICGIELRAGDYKIAWSLDDYLASLEEDLIQALGPEADQNGNETNGTDDRPG